jgi:hypothetical protein
MSVLHLAFQPSEAKEQSYFGGLPHLAEGTVWPLCPTTQQPQLHLLTLSPDFFFTPTLAEGYCLSVFVSFDYERPENIALPREFAISDSSQVTNASRGFCQVLLHKPGTAASPAPSEGYLPLPQCTISRSPFSAQEMKDEVATPGSGLDVSKFGGIPGWLQDDISLGPKYGYLLQVNEYDIRRISSRHEGVFRGGMGYLYLNRNAKKLTPPCEAGYFFIQFT